jgi:transposase
LLRLHCAGRSAQPPHRAWPAGPGIARTHRRGEIRVPPPFYRQSVMYAHDGVEIEPGMMGHWLGSLTWLLNPLVDAIRRYTLDAGKLHTDDTPLTVLALGNGRTKTGRLWVCVRDVRNSASLAAPAVWFAYSPDRSGEHPQTHLKHFRGLLQADAFAGYSKLYRDGHIQEIACWAHARRQIYELLERRPNAFTEEALRCIGTIYAVEEQIRGSHLMNACVCARRRRYRCLWI